MTHHPSETMKTTTPARFFLVLIATLFAQATWAVLVQMIYRPWLV